MASERPSGDNAKNNGDVPIGGSMLARTTPLVFSIGRRAHVNSQAVTASKPTNTPISHLLASSDRFTPCGSEGCVPSAAATPEMSGTYPPRRSSIRTGSW